MGSSVRVLISGQIFENGTTILDPWYTLEEDSDIPLGNPGNISIRYLDRLGLVIAETAFVLTPTGCPFVPNGGDDDDICVYSSEYFGLRIPFVEDTAKIVIHRREEILAERIVSIASFRLSPLNSLMNSRFIPERRR